MFIFVLLLCVHFIFAIILKRKRKLVALLLLPLLSYRYIVTINFLLCSCYSLFSIRRQIAINYARDYSVSNDFLSAFVDSIDVFDCRLPSVITKTLVPTWTQTF